MSNEIELYRIRDVLKRIPISKSLWYKLIKNGQAPLPLKIGGTSRTSMWRKSDIDHFLEEQ
ncbi:MAG: AlpA family phage regulatory protein [Sulfurospirillaceae bacterium]|nr:AlpA family phage regulatory protein [Sulfurospirillaceae bacterium]MDD2827403.1 AlpA family phage regulatory protein [Sulfurospirillaceae bacterium]